MQTIGMQVVVGQILANSGQRGSDFAESGADLVEIRPIGADVCRARAKVRHIRPTTAKSGRESKTLDRAPPTWN